MADHNTPNTATNTTLAATPERNPTTTATPPAGPDTKGTALAPSLVVQTVREENGVELNPTMPTKTIVSRSKLKRKKDFVEILADGSNAMGQFLSKLSDGSR